MIDAIIAADPGVGRHGRRPRRRSWPSRSSSARSRPSYILDMQLRRLTRLERPEARRRARRAARDDRRARGDPRRRRRSCAASSRTSSAEVREKFADERRTRDHPRPRRPRHRGPHRRRGARRHAVGARATSRPSRPTRSARQGRGGRGVRGAKLRDEDYVAHLLTTTAHSYLLFFSNRGRVVPAQGARDPDEGAHRARHRARRTSSPLQPDEHIQAIIDTRDYEDDRYLFFATKQGQGEEDASSTSTTRRCAPGSSPSTCSDGDELVRVIQTNGDDDIFMVSQHGHDDPLLRGRRAADGPRRRRRAGHEAARRRRRGRVAATSPATTPPCSSSPTPATASAPSSSTFNRQGRGGQGVRGIKLTAKQGRRRRRVHGRPRRRDPRDRLGRHHHPHAGRARSRRRAATPPACG